MLEAGGTAVDKGFPSLSPTAGAESLAGVGSKPDARTMSEPIRSWTVAVLVTAGAVAGGLSAAMHASAWSDKPVFSAINTAVIATMVGLGLYLVVRQAETFTGYAFVICGVAWSVSSGMLIVPGWGPYLNWVLSGFPYLAVGWGILRYRRPRLETRAERAFVPLTMLLSSGTSVLASLVVPPEVLGYPADALWPELIAIPEPLPTTMLFLLVGGFLFLAGYFCVIAVRWLHRAPPISRPALRPMTVFGGALAVGAALVHTVASLFPELISLHLSMGLVGTLFLGVTCGLIVSLTLQEMLGARLLDRLPVIRTPQTITDWVARTLDDPTAELLFLSPDTGSLVDHRGHRRSSPIDGDRLHEWIVGGDGTRVALLSGDARTAADRASVSALVRILTLVAENAQLAVLLRMQVAELTATRVAEQLAFTRAQEEFKRNLHDGLQQTLASLRLDVDGLADGPLVDHPAEVDGLMSTLAHALEQVRGLKAGARPPELTFGLKPAVERTVAELRLNATATITDADLGVLTLPVYYVAREALTNVHKHAGANRVAISITTDGDVIDVVVADDGVGGAGGGGHGIDGMRTRIVELGGRLDVQSRGGQGTTVKVRVPCVSS